MLKEWPGYKESSYNFLYSPFISINWSCEPEAVSGNSQINCVYLKPNEPARVLSNEKVEEALSSGVEVSSIHWDELDGIASEFLLSEEILDAP